MSPAYENTKGLRQADLKTSFTSATKKPRNHGLNSARRKWLLVLKTSEPETSRTWSKLIRIWQTFTKLDLLMGEPLPHLFLQKLF